ncbi:hypothetical protein T440DRAFT_546583 [Plenodomus tracheiphilus IPT5]|uniref:Uncharacterized protein n=1 Tax=Plenodomus tracheiphilus IPT5 TaxID=1408161 RepID=A0A6A7ANU5_9PLEO|nr:hypothetical protein T440DRAFT_546583 [Plenodomus tracheiphilus IPT5]
MAFPRIRYKPVKLRVDGDPSLIHYHEPNAGSKPSPTETNFLPLRSRIVTNLFSPISYAQTHAYYEEIDNIPAASVDRQSEFGSGHWYVIHPLSTLNLIVLSPSEMFVQEYSHVVAFKKARGKTLDALEYELEKRMIKAGSGGEAGYTGIWDMLEEDCESGDNATSNIGSEEDLEPKSNHTSAALAEAEAIGREAAEEARLLDEFTFVD